MIPASHCRKVTNLLETFETTINANRVIYFVLGPTVWVGYSAYLNTLKINFREGFIIACVIFNLRTFLIT